ncbi:MAG: DUF1906 domain-containing protein [Gemmatimonadaceae bacterium]|nr:DUF1906 domain-containing protein [Gemmatimonadaceae bacterium]NUP54980.1 DUF1906 domain-containing protein [Gemmatimonadaceae bacterium]NUP71346.1 DUF1906 domain-containing protein [Gemmatimonadaceae bacterium]NUR33154.1 DUF1906 domain-containing protein [Gemmatimonadaceae bacterium]NUS33776.1 DUF1906 domain-containing protein [Gemmatimonadaceae bacterium]
MLDGHVYTAPDGVRGFDTDEKISPKIAAAFHARGYRFCLRYVGRVQSNAKDLKRPEATALLAAGLGVMPVQHVASESAWAPTPTKGRSYGAFAAREAERIGIPPGVTIWCDLEGVAPGTDPDIVIAYCNEWHSAVAKAGFVPGLYVGWHAGLDASQLYYDLRFIHYWAAYNLNADQAPIIRGVQMRQAARKAADRVPGVDVLFQTDRVRGDALGGRPTLLARDGWLD